MAPATAHGFALRDLHSSYPIDGPFLCRSGRVLSIEPSSWPAGVCLHAPADGVCRSPARRIEAAEPARPGGHSPPVAAARVGRRRVAGAGSGAGHTAAIAYGIAILLALVLFLVIRGLDGMRYNLPAPGGRRAKCTASAFLIAAAVLIPVGLWVGFLGGPHRPGMTAGTAFTRITMILFGTALPEEILFRSLIQNWLVQRLGRTHPAIGLAAFIFGCSHLNNAPGPLPNWRYAIVATGAGLFSARCSRLRRASSPRLWCTPG